MSTTHTESNKNKMSGAGIIACFAASVIFACCVTLLLAIGPLNPHNDDIDRLNQQVTYAEMDICIMQKEVGIEPIDNPASNVEC